MLAMITLGIETSCDETAVCLLETDSGGKYRVLANMILSQIDIHKQYGGVFPSIAKREHSKAIIPLIESAFKATSIASTTYEINDIEIRKILEPILLEHEVDTLKAILQSSTDPNSPLSGIPKIDRIVVTVGPGLEPALWVGINCGRALSALWNIPLFGVNHMEGHIVGSLIPDSSVGTEWKVLNNIDTPAIALLVSGGHTELVEVKNIGEYEKIGATRDDASGEAFDKIARMLGLPYPGGPEISRLADEARDKKYPHIAVLPRPMINTDDYSFSFSGLKTAVLYHIKKYGVLSHEMVADIARETEDAIADVLVKKTEKALYDRSAKTLIVGGGVSANTYIRNRILELADRMGVAVFLPPKGVSGDNALMIALAGAMTDKKIALRAEGNLSL
jgi:N6-L-threonylcarbamoyladenine synthase